MFHIHVSSHSYEGGSHKYESVTIHASETLYTTSKFREVSDHKLFHNFEVANRIVIYHLHIDPQFFFPITLTLSHHKYDIKL